MQGTQRQSQAKWGSVTGLARISDIPAMGHNDLSDDHQPKSASGTLGGGERLKDVDLRRDANTRVRNLQNDICSGAVGVERECATLGHGFDGVLAQIPERLL